MSNGSKAALQLDHTIRASGMLAIGSETQALTPTGFIATLEGRVARKRIRIITFTDLHVASLTGQCHFLHVEVFFQQTTFYIKETERRR
jgi:hypothetical protein